MQKALAIAVAVHALVAFVPIGSTDAPRRPPDVIQLRVRAAPAPAPPATVEPPAPALSPAVAAAPAAPVSPPALRPRRERAARAARNTTDNAPTVTRSSSSQELAAQHAAPIAAPEAPSIQATASNLGALGDAPPVAPSRFVPGTYAQTVRDLMAKQKRYPRRARRREVQGVVVVSLSIDTRGRVVGAPRVRRSSGSGELDREGLRMARAAAPFPPPLGATETVTIDVPVRFSLGPARRD